MEDRPKVSTIAGRPFSKNTIYNIIDEHEHSRIQNMGRFQTGAAHIFDKALLFPRLLRISILSCRDICG